MQTWLSVEENCISIGQVSIHYISNSQLICPFGSISKGEIESDKGAILLQLLDVVGTWVIEWAIDYQSLQLVNVVSIHTVRVRQSLGHQDGHYHFVYTAVWIWRDNSSSCEVDTLPR